MNALSQPAPQSIRNEPAQQQVSLVWNDGETSSLSWLLLRSACQCSGCRARRLKGTISLLDPDIRVTTINNMVYGIQLVFSDGHERGIFPWSYLRQLSYPEPVTPSALA